MDKTIVYHKKVKLNKPIMLVGLPGIGNVGSIVGKYLKDALGAKKFAVLQSPHFPHQVVMQKNGGMRIVNNRFYYYKSKAGKPDIVILIGDTQAGSPEGQYDVNEKIVMFFKKLGGTTVYTVGGYNVGNQYVHTPRVFAVVSDKATKVKLVKYGIVFGKAAGMIWGSAGMIAAFAKKYGMSSACIMGETGLLEMDANSAKAVLEVLKKLLYLDVDLGDIEKIKKETERMLKEIEEATKTMAGGPPADPGHGEAIPYIR